MNYKELCCVLDEILLENKESVYRIANSWLHIPRRHPELMNSYSKNNYKLFFYYLANQLFKIAKSIKFSNEKNYELNGDVLIVSHFLSANLSDNKDFYFDEIRKILNENGLNSNTIFIDHTSKKHKSSKYNYPNLIIRNLGLIREIRMFYRLSIEMLNIIKRAYKEKDKKKKAIYLRAAIEQISPSTFNNLRIGINVNEYIKNNKFTKLITTFEGHGWERVCYHLNKSTNNKIICIGYQHAVVFEEQHSIKRSIAKESDPDIIWTSGEVGKIELEKYIKNAKIINVGTHKYINKISRWDKIKNVILVLPEGFIQESVTLLEFSFCYALNNINCIFIWRLHPSIDYESIRKKSRVLPFKTALPPNIIYSESSINSDIEKSSYMLYRGSTSSIEGFNQGLVPLYLRKKNEDYSIDPLIQSKGVGIIITTEADLTNKLKVNLKRPNFKVDYFSQLDRYKIITSMKHASIKTS